MSSGRQERHNRLRFPYSGRWKESRRLSFLPIPFQIGCREIAGSAKRNDIVEYFQVVDIFRSEQGAATGAGGRHQDLVFLEVRMFQYDLDTVVECQDRRAEQRVRLHLPDLSRSGQFGDQRFVGNSLFIGFDR